LTVDSSWGGEGITGGVYWLAVDGIIKGFVTVEFRLTAKTFPAPGFRARKSSLVRVTVKPFFPATL